MSNSCPNCGSSSATEIFTKKGYVLVKCSSCGLVRVANPPSEEELKQLYSFETGYHSNLDHDAVEAGHQTRAEHNYDFLKKYCPRPGRLVDIGCSTGLFLRVAQASGWDVSGVEMSPDSSRVARDRYGLDVQTGTIADSHFPAKSLDVVTLWDVIEHLPQPGEALEPIREWLADDGVLILETPNIDGLFPSMSYKLARRLDHWPHPEPPGHLFQFSKKTLASMLLKAGFRIENIRDERIPLDYSFGSLNALIRSPKRSLYGLAFAPTALIGPWVGAGDTIKVTARKV